MTEPSHQLALALGPFQNQRLFAEHFLADRLPQWPEFRDRDSSDLLRNLRALYSAERASLAAANEAQTEERFVQPVLRALGFAYTVQAGLQVAGGRRQPDYALFLSEADRVAAATSEGSGYERAVAVADAKRFNRALDRRAGGVSLSEDPVAQIIHYVAVTRRPWGILTNGRLWRLYGAQRELVEGACLEFDLVSLLESEDAGAFNYFAAFLAADAFRPGPDGRSFLDRALDESTAGSVQVGEALQRQVFSAVPLIAEGLLSEEEERTREVLADAFDNALVLLYRLLFCLYAEARGLLPLDNPHYREYSLRAQREALAEAIGRGRVFSTASDDLYNDLRALFRIVDRGDDSLGVTEYDGGLFAAERHPYFRDRSVPDRVLAPALDRLYRVAGEQVDYRDLSVRHLGTLYERLLDWRLEERDGMLVLVPASGRHESGSYFTPEHVVDRIVERTLEPLLGRRSREIAEAGLRGGKALDRFLELRVLDPAMGSGHFLVSAGAYIAQYVATDPSYDGGLELAEIERLVAERSLYGVDLNPMRSSWRSFRCGWPRSGSASHSPFWPTCARETRWWEPASRSSWRAATQFSLRRWHATRNGCWPPSATFGPAPAEQAMTCTPRRRWRPARTRCVSRWRPTRTSNCVPASPMERVGSFTGSSSTRRCSWPRTAGRGQGRDSTRWSAIRHTYAFRSWAVSWPGTAATGTALPAGASTSTCRSSSAAWLCWRTTGGLASSFPTSSQSSTTRAGCASVWRSRVRWRRSWTSVTRRCSKARRTTRAS